MADPQVANTFNGMAMALVEITEAQVVNLPPQKIWAILSLTENPYSDLELWTVAPERHPGVTISQNKSTKNLKFYTSFTDEQCCHTETKKNKKKIPKFHTAT